MFRPIVLACFAAFLLILTFSASSIPNSEAAPTAEQATVPVSVPPSLPQSGGTLSSLMGVQMMGSQGTASLVSSAQQMGAKWARVYVSWASIEPNDPRGAACTITQTCANLVSYDTSFKNLAAAGIEPIATIAFNPAWAASFYAGPLNSAGLAAWPEFVRAVTQRYNGSQPGLPAVRYWELYNEPDIVGWFGAPPLPPPNPYPNYGDAGPKGYAEILHAASPVIRAASPNNRVVLGGLAYEFQNSAFDPAFLTEVNSYLLTKYGQNGLSLFDVTNFHYYTRIGYWMWGNSILNKALRLKQDYGLTKPILITEFGEPWGWTPCDPMQPLSSHDQATSALLRTMIQMLAGADPGYNVAFIGGSDFTFEYFREDAGTCTSQPNGLAFPRIGPNLKAVPPSSSTPDAVGDPMYRHWGLLDSNNNPSTEEYAIFRRLGVDLGDATYVGKLDVSSSSNPSVTEGYVLSSPSHGRVNFVWSKDYNISPTLSFHSTAIVKRDLRGTTTTIRDGDAADLDGRTGYIGLTVGNLPVQVSDLNSLVTRFIPLACAAGCP